MNNNISVCVFTTVKNSNRYLTVKNTWGKDFENFYIFGGRCDINQDNIIILDVDDSYEGLTEKHMIMLEYLMNLPKTDWYYISVDDAFLYREHAENMLEKHNSEDLCFIGGSIGLMKTRIKEEYQKDINHEYFCSGGPGYFISRKLLEKLSLDVRRFLEEWKYINNTILNNNINGACDFAICYMISKYYNLSIIYEDGFYHLPPYRYPHDTNEVGVITLIDKPIAYHNLNTQEIQKLYDNMQINKFTL